MGLDRREVVKLGTAAAVGATLPGWAAGAADQNADFETAFRDTLSRLRNVFTSDGLTEAQPESIATGADNYNGGLRHDFDQAVLPTGMFVFQPLARVGDVAEKGRNDVLPFFHEVGCHPAADSDGEMTTRLMVRLLTQDLGLDPTRIAFVSVPQSSDMRPVLDQLDMPFSQKVLLRPEAEALAARDASGFFFPDPFGDAYLVTMGVYYRIGDTDAPAPASYPPSSDWTEIGEIVIQGDAAPLGISIGAERLTYALTGQYPSWDQRLGALFAQAAREGVEPPGLAAFR